MPKDKPTKVEIFKSLEDFADKSPVIGREGLTREEASYRLLQAIRNGDITQTESLIREGAAIIYPKGVNPRITSHVYSFFNTDELFLFIKILKKTIEINDIKLMKMIFKSNIPIDNSFLTHLAGCSGNLNMIEELLKINPKWAQDIASSAAYMDNLHVLKYFREKDLDFKFTQRDKFDILKYFRDNMLDLSIYHLGANGSKILRWEVANRPQSHYHLDNFRATVPEVVRFFLSKALIEDVNSNLNEELEKLTKHLIDDIKPPIYRKDILILLSLGAQINTNDLSQADNLEDKTRAILNSGTTSENIAAALNILNTLEGLSTTNKLNTLKPSIRELLKTKLQNFDHRLEAQNIKEYFREKCIGDLVDYIQQLNSMPSIIQRYEEVYNQDPELSSLMNKFKTSQRKLVDTLETHKTDLLIDHIVFDARPDTTSELQKELKGMMIDAHKTQEGNLLLDGQKSLLKELLNYYSSKDLGELGV